MIKGNELRIGNLLKTKSGKTIKKVDAVHGEGTEWYKFKGSREIEFSDTTIAYCCANYLPIDITPKWLIRAGFVTSDNIWFKIKSKNEIVFEISSSGLFAIDNTSTIRCINYLHELQNLYFALTGEELVFSSTEP